jgi:PmbA protein
MFIQPGSKSLADLVAGIDKGLVVIDLQGAHSGANPVSGDFSLGAFGYLVEGGKIIRPVNQITVAGNFFELLQDITGVGSDMHFGLPGGSQLGSPSLLISKLSVAGK